jgi:hypothetical protein
MSIHRSIARPVGGSVFRGLAGRDSPGLGLVLNADFSSGVWPSSLPLPASRGSGATMIDANGDVVWGPENLYRNSADFSYWSYLRVTGQVITEGYNGSKGLVLTATDTANCYAYRHLSEGTIAGIKYYFGAKIKRGPSQPAGLVRLAYTDQGVSSAHAEFDISDPDPANWFLNDSSGLGDISITKLDDEWALVSASKTPSSNTGSDILSIRMLAPALGDDVVISEPFATRNPDMQYFPVSGTQLGYHAPRLTYDPVTGECLGYLVEEQATEACLDNTDIGGTNWLSNEVTTASDVAFRGYDWPEWRETTATGIHRVYQNFAPTPSGETYFEFYYLPQGRAQLNLYDTGYTGIQIHVDTDAVTIAPNNTSVVPESSIKAVEDGWFRIRFSVRAATTNFRLALAFSPSDAFAFNYAGDVTKGGVFAFPSAKSGGWSSFIPTTGSTVVRQEDPWDNYDITGLIPDAEGAFVVEVIPFKVGSAEYVFGVSEPTRNYGQIYASAYSNTQGRVRMHHDPLSSTSWLQQATWDIAGLNGVEETSRIACAWAEDDVAACVNGGNVVTDDSASVVDNLTEMTLGSSGADGDGGARSASIIRSVKLYKTRISDAKLQSLTL